ncbi:MAG TPA: septum formation initiator family protein [Candidatus Acidoferrum sp.]|nr:septum formation initiator family protein [Candidatus Acidoferrum sp.]
MRLSFVLRREWLSLIFGGVLVMLVLSALLGNLGPRDLLALQSHRAELEARRDRLAADNAAFRTRVQKLRSDDRYVERLIRRELGYARSDELVYKFADDHDHNETPSR